MTTTGTTSFSVPLGPAAIAERIAAVVAPDSAMVRWGGRTSQLPFVGTVGKASFAFRRPGRNSFKPLFVDHIRESSGATAVDIEARNIFTARNPVVLFATVFALVLVGGAALTSGRGSALAVLVLGALAFGVLYFGIGWWQRAEIRRIFVLIERVVSARTVDEARSIVLTAQ
jgi:hypothetical protein